MNLRFNSGCYTRFPNKNTGNKLVYIGNGKFKVVFSSTNRSFVRKRSQYGLWMKKLPISSTVINMVNINLFQRDSYLQQPAAGGCLLQKQALKTLLCTNTDLEPQY